MMKHNTLKMAVICAVVSTMFLTHTSNVFANTATAVKVTCSGPCPANNPDCYCATTTYQGVTARSKGVPPAKVEVGIKCIDAKAMELDVHNYAVSNQTSIFVIDSISPGGDTIGTGHFNVVALYDVEQGNNLFYNMYYLDCSSNIQIANYQDWLAFCCFLSNNCSTTEYYDVVITPLTLTFSTELENVYIKLVDLVAEVDITGYIPVDRTATIDISELPIGCRYSLMISTNNGSEVFTTLFSNYNFCK